MLIPVLIMLVVFGAISTVEHWQFGKILEDDHRELAVVKVTNFRERLQMLKALPERHELQRIVDHEARLIQARASLIAADGFVMTDSEVPFEAVGSLGNHGLRPEVADAYRRGIGVSERYSKSVKRELLYAATPFIIGNTSGVVRIAVDTAQIAQEISKQRLNFILFAIFGISAAAGLGIAAAMYLAKHLRREHDLLEQRVAERTEEVYHLQNFGTLLSACKDMEETRDIIEKIVPNLLPRVRGSLSLFRASRNLLEGAATWGGAWPGSENYIPDECWGLRTGRTYPSEDVQAARRCGHLDTEHDQFTLCIPMAAHGETVGVFSLVKDSKEPFNTAERQMAFLIAEQVSLADANISLRNSLREQAIRDPLTGLFNRRYLLESMEQEIRRAERINDTFVVMMLDVDFFKKFNDTHGHDAGDLVLAKLGKVFTKAIRGHDIACRYGGEEFTILLTSGGRDLAVSTAERLCNMVREVEIVQGSTLLSGLSVSIGCAIYPDHGSTPADLLKAADDALYRAKKNGRDRCVLAGEADGGVVSASAPVAASAEALA